MPGRLERKFQQLMKRTFALIALAAVTTGAFAQTTATGEAAPRDLGLTGTTDFDAWTTLSNSVYAGYGNFPGLSPWPGGIASNLGGDAEVVKVANGAGGGPYVGSGSLYFGGFSDVPNTFGGTVAAVDGSALAGLNTVVFQVQIAEAWGYDLFSGIGPVLSYNGGTQRLAATYSNTMASVFNGTFTTPLGEEDLFINLQGFQWDLNSISDPITSFSIEFSAVQHAQIYGMRLDQTDAVYGSAVVPEPATSAALGLGAAALLRRKKKNA